MPRSTEPKSLLSERLSEAMRVLDDIMMDIRKGYRLSEDEALALRSLSAQAQFLRESMIKLDLQSGMLGKEIASKYDISPSRVSQYKRIIKKENM